MTQKYKDILMALGILAIIASAIIFSYFYSKGQNDARTSTDNSLIERSNDFGILKLSYLKDKEFGDGTKFNPDDYKGKLVVANFWSASCHFCIAELPHFQKVYEKYKDNDKVKFLMINLGDSSNKSKQKVRKFFSDSKYTMPILFDEDAEVFQKIGARATPITAFVGGNGEAFEVQNINGHGIYYWMGFLNEKSLEELIESSLKINEKQASAPKN